MTDTKPAFSFKFDNLNPLSVNRAWQGRRFKTKEYSEYEQLWTAILRRRKTPIEGPVQITFNFHWKHWAIRDVDNPVKLLIDVVVKLGYLKNDTQVCRLLATKCKHSSDSIYFAITKLKDEPHFCD